MRYLILPVLFAIFVAAPAAHAQGLEDFSNISRAIGKEVSVVDRSGLIREGILEAATADAVTLRVGSATQWLPRADVASAERMKDESSDGALRGAIWALAVALIPNQGWTSAGDYLRSVAIAFVVFPTAGYLLDAAESNRQPLYRAPSASSPTLKISFRF
jgi:hypothetical protein